jgi:hypothetical protein
MHARASDELLRFTIALFSALIILVRLLRIWLTARGGLQRDPWLEGSALEAAEGTQHHGCQHSESDAVVGQ